MSPPPESEFILHSVTTGTLLRFVKSRSCHFTATLESPEFRLLREVFCNPNYLPIETLSLFFRDLAEQQKAWSGVKEWRVADGEIAISAVCSVTGKITFTVKLHQYEGRENWKFETLLESELGQMPALAVAAEAFIKTIEHGT